jgi:hypothetical protein
MKRWELLRLWYGRVVKRGLFWSTGRGSGTSSNMNRSTSQRAKSAGDIAAYSRLVLAIGFGGFLLLLAFAGFGRAPACWNRSGQTFICQAPTSGIAFSSRTRRRPKPIAQAC